ncbi:MAG: hypothetical protein HYR91_11945, partial [Flavobacteriia bacterium]|nr:hypothetical protein [Flavobacteriia bacterium]
MKIIPLIVFSCLFIGNTFAFKVIDINYTIDSSNFGSQNSFSISVNLINKRGKSFTVIPNENILKWKKITVKGNHILGSKNGVIHFDQTAVNAMNNKIELEVSYDNIQSYTQVINLPYVKGIGINNS